MNENGSFPGRDTAAAFPTTQWGAIIEASRSGEPDSGSALAELCRLYWSPLYAYLRRSGHSSQDSEDLVQAFLLRIIERDSLTNVDPEKGRFRTFLLAALRNYVLKQIEHDSAIKRGGGKPILPILDGLGERLCGADLKAESPEIAYDRRWCRTVLARALESLRAEYRARKREEIFDQLSPLLDGVGPGEIAQVAEQIGMEPNAVAVAVHRMRSRLQELVRAEVLRTVASASEAETEMRYLMSVWDKQM